jgi:hypothetical protein
MAGKIEQWKLSYQVSPIFLTGAPVSNVPSGMVPFLALVNPQAFPTANARIAAYNPGAPAPQTLNYQPDLSDVINRSQTSLDNAFGAFNVLAGGSLIQQTVAKYPFANQSYAANAIIRDPLHISLIWDTPMRGSGAWSQKLVIMQAVKQRLDAHNNAGGTYTVATPAYIYENLIMTSLTDASRGSSNLPQNAWRFDFERPLVTLQELKTAQSALMSKLTNGVVTDGSWSGGAAGIGSLTPQPQMSPGAGTSLPTGMSVGVPTGAPSGPAYNPGASVPYAAGPVTRMNPSH